MSVHASAIIEDGATLSSGVEVGPFCFVGSNVALGEGVRLHSHIVVSGHTKIGARTIVHAQVVLGGVGQIRDNDYAEGSLVIGSDCVIREGVTMSCGSRAGRGMTTVGNNGYFMAMSHVGHDCIVEDDVTFANGAVLGGHTWIGQGVILGGLSAVQQYCRVGKGAMIGGVTGVNTDVIPYGMAIGDHAVLGGLNVIGLKRRGVSREVINEVRSAFRAIFLSTKGSLFDRARNVKESWPDNRQVQEITDFILADAKRGLCVADPSRRHAGED
jgi:UDP-N-acetylglucosamine acyltransferase